MRPLPALLLMPLGAVNKENVTDSTMGSRLPVVKEIHPARIISPSRTAVAPGPLHRGSHNARPASHCAKQYKIKGKKSDRPRRCTCPRGAAGGAGKPDAPSRRTGFAPGLAPT